MRRVHWLLLVLLLVALVATGVHLRLRALAAEAALAPEAYPAGLSVGGSGVALWDRDQVATFFWSWDIRQFQQIVRDAIAGASGAGTELQSLPFSCDGDLAAGEERISANYDPPIRFAVAHYRKADALALYAPSPSSEVSLYLRTPEGKWFRYDTSLRVSRLIKYRETIADRASGED